MECTVFFKRHADRPVAAGDHAHRAFRQLPGESIGCEPPLRGRLENERWIRLRDESDHRLAPTSVVREFEYIGAEVDHALRRAILAGGRGKTGGRLGLDVAGQEDPRARVVLDHHDQRVIVVTRRPVAALRPQHTPSSSVEWNFIARGDCPDRSASMRGAREQRVDRGHAPARLDKGRVHDDLAHAGIPHDVQDRAEVIEIRMRDHDRIDDTSGLHDDREQC